MNIQTVKLSNINSPENNPRQSFNKGTIEGLADSIKTDGLLQNLVVAPTKGNKYRIISGERRYRALQLLLERNDITSDYDVSVEIRKKLSKQDELRIATVENVQREKLPPMDEAEAFTSLAQKGATLPDLSAQTGFTEKTIKRRLALANLCDEAKQVLRNNEITLSVAEALTVGSHDLQRSMLEKIENYDYDAEDIKEELINQKPSVSLAIFPLEKYQGTFTTDLFAEDDSTYFDDEEQFVNLQKEAIAEKKEQYLKNGVSFVELTQENFISTWLYRDAEEGDNAGVVINLSSHGKVDILENVLMYNVDKEIIEETVVKKRSFYSSPLCRNMALHKSMAVQAELLNNPKLCKIISILGMLNNRSVHNCLYEFSNSDIQPKGYAVINETAKEFLELLPSLLQREDGEWHSLKYSSFNDGTMFNELLSLDEGVLDRLQVLLVAMNFGQSNCDSLDTNENSVFNLVALKMDVDMIKHWRPDAEFLKRRNKDQLSQISKDSGVKLAIRSNTKKSDIVSGLEKKFSQVSEQGQFSENDVKIDTWLPKAMQFPAVDITEQKEEAA